MMGTCPLCVGEGDITHAFLKSLETRKSRDEIAFMLANGWY
jgi:hypothetical protein